MKRIDAVVSMCIQRGYVSKDSAPWLRYALEKKIVSLPPKEKGLAHRKP